MEPFATLQGHGQFEESDDTFLFSEHSDKLIQRQIEADEAAREVLKYFDKCQPCPVSDPKTTQASAGLNQAKPPFESSLRHDSMGLIDDVNIIPTPEVDGGTRNISTFPSFQDFLNYRDQRQIRQTPQNPIPRSPIPRRIRGNLQPGSNGEKNNRSSAPQDMAHTHYGSEAFWPGIAAHGRNIKRDTIDVSHAVSRRFSRSESLKVWIGHDSFSAGTGTFQAKATKVLEQTDIVAQRTRADLDATRISCTPGEIPVSLALAIQRELYAAQHLPPLPEQQQSTLEQKHYKPMEVSQEAGDAGAEDIYPSQWPAIVPVAETKTDHNRRRTYTPLAKWKSVQEKRTERAQAAFKATISNPIPVPDTTHAHIVTVPVSDADIRRPAEIMGRPLKEDSKEQRASRRRAETKAREKNQLASINFLMTTLRAGLKWRRVARREHHWQHMLAAMHDAGPKVTRMPGMRRKTLQVKPSDESFQCMGIECKICNMPLSHLKLSPPEAVRREDVVSDVPWREGS